MKKIAAVLFLAIVMLAVCTPAYAAPHLDFVATNVYWEGPYRLAVEGYFQNTGNKIIDGITYFEFTIYYARGGEYRYLGKGVWNGNSKLAKVYLYPGESSDWTFSIHTDRYLDFTYWECKSYVEYIYKK